MAGCWPVGGRLTGDLPLQQAVGRRLLARGQGDAAGGAEVDRLPLAAATRHTVGRGVASQGPVQRLQRRDHSGLLLLPDDVDLAVVGDALQGDVGHPFVDEALTDAAVGWALGR